MIQVVKALPAATYGGPTLTSYDGDVWGFVAVSPTSIDSTWSHDNGLAQPLIAGTKYESGPVPWRSLQIFNASPGLAAAQGTAYGMGGVGGGGSLAAVTLAIARSAEDVEDLPVPAINYRFLSEQPAASTFTWALSVAQVNAAQSVFFAMDPGYARVGVAFTLTNNAGGGAAPLIITINDALSSFQFTENIPANGSQLQNTYEIWWGEGASGPLIFNPPSGGPNAYQVQPLNPAVIALNRNVNTNGAPIRLNFDNVAPAILSVAGKFFQW
jgi:hypothetical protein